MAEVFNVSLEYLVSADELFVVDATEAGGTRGRVSAEQLINKRYPLLQAAKCLMKIKTR